MSDTRAIEHPIWLMNGDSAPSTEPFRLFAEWFAQAKQVEPTDPDAMALATVDADGLPNCRMVLLKDFDERGFVFYTNLDSAKGKELRATPLAALVFHWKSLQRQVRLRGQVEPVTSEEADAYFASRARLSQIGAWASKQSAALESRFALEQACARYAAKFALGSVPRPENWSGFRLVPTVIEFWQDQPFRLHHRVEYRRASPRAAWTKTRLYP
ncbi:MAG: pyridoxamine 5'-phosphate oxidase [Rhizobiales bacterium]|nr:pyridoxamine 5'-phosphate oxidase [Hyphomicrobiales bacterium]